MYDKDKNYERYSRERYSFAESLFERYLEMRKSFHKLEQIKYSTTDDFATSKEGKEGFIAGVYIMMSLFMDV